MRKRTIFDPVILSKTWILMVFMALARPAQCTTCDSLPKGSSQMVSLLLHKNFDAFERSHFGGVGAEYTLTNGKFSGSTAGTIGWLATGGIDFFPGRQDPAEGYAFRYASYFYGHLGAGVIYVPASFVNLVINAGPGAGLYHGNTTFGLHASASANIFIDPRFTIGPSATWRREKEANSLWTGAIRVGYIF